MSNKVFKVKKNKRTNIYDGGTRKKDALSAAH